MFNKKGQIELICMCDYNVHYYNYIYMNLITNIDYISFIGICNNFLL